MKPMNVTSHDTSGLREKMTLPKAVKGESQLLVNLSTTEFPAHCQTASGQKPPSQIAAYEQKKCFFKNCQNDQNVKGAFKQIKLVLKRWPQKRKSCSLTLINFVGYCFNHGTVGTNLTRTCKLVNHLKKINDPQLCL